MEEKKHCCENVFEAIGFPPDEAAALKVRADITSALQDVLKKRGKKQKEIAAEPGLTNSRVSEIMHDPDKFSIDKLVMLLARAGKKVSIAIS